MAEPAFNQLRTTEQLCYSIECGVRQSYGVQGFVLKLVSGTHSGKHMLQSVMRFLDQFETYLEQMSDEMFQQHVASTIKRKMQPVRQAETVFVLMAFSDNNPFS